MLYIVLVKVFTRVDWKYYTGFTLLCYGKTIAIHPLASCDVYTYCRWSITVHDDVCSFGTG